jgi:predicted Zn-dependent protease with MMP-like domain
MITVSDDEFAKFITEAWDSLPGEHVRNLKNVAVTWEDEPSAAQKEESRLTNHQTLLGLYRGVPLSERQGNLVRMPDRITLFKGPLCMVAGDIRQLQEQIRHTLWHEIGHYYGLNHTQIHDRE